MNISILLDILLRERRLGLAGISNTLEFQEDVVCNEDISKILPQKCRRAIRFQPTLFHIIILVSTFLIIGPEKK